MKVSVEGGGQVLENLIKQNWIDNELYGDKVSSYYSIEQFQFRVSTTLTSRLLEKLNELGTNWGDHVVFNEKECRDSSSV